MSICGITATNPSQKFQLGYYKHIFQKKYRKNCFRMLLTSSLNSNLKVMPKIIFAFSSSDNSTVLFMLFFKYFKKCFENASFCFQYQFIWRGECGKSWYKRLSTSLTQKFSKMSKKLVKYQNKGPEKSRLIRKGFWIQVTL